jgi:hypothetical protein
VPSDKHAYRYHSSIIDDASFMHAACDDHALFMHPACDVDASCSDVGAMLYRCGALQPSS